MRTDNRSDVHLFPNDKEGHALLHQLQQRAEAWAEAVRNGAKTSAAAR